MRDLTGFSRRDWLRLTTTTCVAGGLAPTDNAARAAELKELRISKLKVTPVALPDPPILAASGCHGPYFLRSIIEIETDEGVGGIGEAYGNLSVVNGLNDARDRLLGTSAFRIRHIAEQIKDLSPAVFAAIEMACLDAVGRAMGKRVCALVGGPVRDEVEFAAYLFYRYAADHPAVLSDSRLVDERGKGDRALDHWGEVRTAEAMADLADGFRKKWGFRVLKLKAGVLRPSEELKTLNLWQQRFGDEVPLRIDPNGRWRVATAVEYGRLMKSLPLEYYEDPVSGQAAMAKVRADTGLTMATNSCVSRWQHVQPAVTAKPIDAVLGDIYWYGGITGNQALSRVAAHLGWGVGYHSNNHSGVTMAAMIHAGAATPEINYALDTHYVWLPEGADIIEGNNLPIENGRMKIPIGAGLGVKLDQDKLARAHEAYVKSGMKNRNDSETIQRFQPGWTRALF